VILRLQSAVAILTCCFLVTATSASATAVGIVMTSGKVQVDGSQVPGSAVVFAGSLVSAGDRSSNIQFSDGSVAIIRPGASVIAYRERSVLQRGVAMQRAVDRHPVSAAELRISGLTPNSAALVGMKDETHIEVAAQEGASEVRSSQGALVAHLEQGTVLSFTLMQANGTQQIVNEICGDLDENHQLIDMLTQITYQLQGSGLDAYIRKSIRITGTVQGVPSGSQPRVFLVSSVKQLNHPCVNGPGAAPEAVSALTRGSLVFLILVGAGGALLGVGAAGGFGTSPSPVTPSTP